MLKTIKATVLSCALIASVLFTSACNAGVSSTTATALKPARIAVGLDPTYALVYVAQEQGYFKKHGVEATLVQTEGGPSMIQAISNPGRASGGVGASHKTTWPASVKDEIRTASTATRDRFRLDHDYVCQRPAPERGGVAGKSHRRSPRGRRRGS